MKSLYKSLFLFIFVIFINHNLFSQSNNRIDSLEYMIDSVNGMSKLKILSELADYYINSDLDICLKYASQLLIESDRIKLNNNKRTLLFRKLSKITQNFEKSPEVYKSSAYSLLGQAYFFSDNIEKSIESFKKLLHIELKNDNQVKIARAYNNLGIVYRYVEKYDSSLMYYKKALKLYEENNNTRGVSSTYNNLGVLNEEGFKNYRLAELYYRKSLKKELILNDKEGIATSYLNIGGVLGKQKKYSDAINYCNKSIKISELINDKITLRYNYKVLYTIYKEKNNYEEALYWYEKYANIRDSIFNNENTKQIQELEVQYETEKKEKEILLLNNQKRYNELLLKKNKEEIRKQRIIIIMFILGIISIIFFSFYLIRENKRKKRLNKKLTEQNAEIIMQKEEIVSQRDEIESQRDEIITQHEKIRDSINYARKIQNAMLPPTDALNSILEQYFVYYLPRDIVSGDFYYVKKINNYIITCVADCTGHGVPGAFMSMLGITLLNEIVFKREITTTNQALESLREQLKRALHQSSDTKSAKDGMDLSLCAYDTTTKVLQFSGANNGIFIVRDNELIILKPDKNPIGWYHKESPFTVKEIKIKKNDTIYMYSDGYMDQFNGKTKEKYKMNRFKNLLLEINNYDMKKQHKILSEEHNSWKDNTSQLDDVLILGIRYQKENK